MRMVVLAYTGAEWEVLECDLDATGVERLFSPGSSKL